MKGKRDTRCNGSYCQLRLGKKSEPCSNEKLKEFQEGLLAMKVFIRGQKVPQEIALIVYRFLVDAGDKELPNYVKITSF